MTWAERLACVVCLAAVGCSDYFYGSMVRGRVVAPDGESPTSIDVCFVRPDDTPEAIEAALTAGRPFECTKPSEDGAFEYRYTGLGPKPDVEAVADFRLAAIRAGRVLTTVTYEAKWTDGVGFFAEDVELRIDGD